MAYADLSGISIEGEVIHPFDPDSILSMAQSLASLALCLSQIPALDEALAKRLSTVVHDFQICTFNFAGPTAAGASVYAGFSVVAEDGYRDLCTALVLHHNHDFGVEFGVEQHGWPILVLRGDSAPATIAEGGAAANAGLNNRRRSPEGRP